MQKIQVFCEEMEIPEVLFAVCGMQNSSFSIVKGMELPQKVKKKTKTHRLPYDLVILLLYTPVYTATCSS